MGGDIGGIIDPIIGGGLGFLAGGPIGAIAGAGMGMSYHQGQQAQSLAQQQIEAAREAALLADPFRGQRGFYQGMLKDLMTDPDFLKKSPLYEQMQESGISAVERTSAKGMLHSGQRLLALQEAGQGASEKLFMDYAGILSGLSGATTSNPAAAASAYEHGMGTAGQFSLYGQGLYSQALGQGLFALSHAYDLFGGGEK